MTQADIAENYWSLIAVHCRNHYEAHPQATVEIHAVFLYKKTIDCPKQLARRAPVLPQPKRILGFPAATFQDILEQKRQK